MVRDETVRRDDVAVLLLNADLGPQAFTRVADSADLRRLIASPAFSAEMRARAVAEANGTALVTQDDEPRIVDIARFSMPKSPAEMLDLCERHDVPVYNGEIERAKEVIRACNAVNDRFDFVTVPRPQPDDRRQVTARRNASQLLVFEVGR